MPAISCSAPGKVILCGEHAVVYGRPAIAIPVFNVSTTCKVFAKPVAMDGDVLINAPVIGLKTNLSRLEEGHPIRKTIELVLQSLGIDHLPSCEILVNSTIPLAAGLGSSASTSVAIIRAVSTFVGHPLDERETNRIAFEIEKLHHKTPSGIDNSVITYGKTLFFIKETASIFLNLKMGLSLIIADTGIKSSTAKAVSDVRTSWQNDQVKFEKLFTEIGALSSEIKNNLEIGDIEKIGPLLSQNHSLLQEMGVSCPELDHLVDTALANGALGAKLSGGGQGGNMIALVDPANGERISKALQFAGAVNTIYTHVPAEGEIIR